MRRTFSLPDGSKVRTRTVRDLVLIIQSPGQDGHVAVRSDNLKTIGRHARWLHQRATSASLYVGDTVTGELRQYGGAS